MHTGREFDVEIELAVSTDRVNQRQKGILVRKLRCASVRPIDLQCAL